MASATASRFSKQRTLENFRAWSDAEPTQAAAWLKRFATQVGATDLVAQLDAFKVHGAGGANRALLATSFSRYEVASRTQLPLR